jgi:hypothetical protein
VKFVRFDKLFKDIKRERDTMSNKKFQKVVVYAMIVIMILSTIAMGVSMIG